MVVVLLALQPWAQAAAGRHCSSMQACMHDPPQPPHRASHAAAFLLLPHCAVENP
jgi:hypothetical protein